MQGLKDNSYRVVEVAATYAKDVNASIFITVEDAKGRCLMKLPIGWPYADHVIGSFTKTLEKLTRKDG